ncbi:MAG: MBL fold metallo-hydrolase [Candidatus Electrothrix sp. AX5]|nr:MBL fold metallo-hydrolase [Candidatus Electrothrix sp. AX5]
MSNTAKEIIIPIEPNIFRTIFLYVGQGDSTLLVVPEGDKYKYVLIDSNYDENAGGIDIIALLEDLFDGEDKKIDVYINTHPHKDHLSKVKEIFESVGIDQLWHSGHKPGGDHKDSYDDLEFVMKKLGEENVFRLRGSQEENKLDDEKVILGKINYNILAPADYVSDEIEDEKPDARYARIHEQCGVIRFKYGTDEKQILITGDADYEAWKQHITDYHKERLPSTVLSAAHHGSRTFFWKDSNTEEDPYKEHLKNIKPTYVTVSAPKKKESRHEHPHKEAMDLYKEEVGNDKVFHLGEKRECIIVDITASGEIDLYPDDELVKKYGKKNGGGNSDSKKAVIPPPVSKLDKKPMGL